VKALITHNEEEVCKRNGVSDNDYAEYIKNKQEESDQYYYD
jgi:hypothetical protein